MTKLTSTMFLSAIFLTIISLNLFLLVDAQSLTKIKFCGLMFANVDDLGWTFSFNKGRLDALAELEAKYPTVEFSSYVLPNAYLKHTGTQEQAAKLWQTMLDEQCNVLMLIGCCYFDDFSLPIDPKALSWWQERADNYPNMSFIVLWGRTSALQYTEKPNLVFFINDYTSSYFLAGVAAATQASTCAGIMVPYAWHRSSHDAATGFALGVQYANASMPVHIMEMNSFYAPWNELKVVKILTEEYGCEVIARYSDPRDVDVYIQNTRSSGVMSIGSHSDLQQYVGDTVLTSAFVDWKKIIVPLISRLLDTGSIQPGTPQVYGVSSGVSVVSRVSPRANAKVQKAVDAAKEDKLKTSDSLLCGDPLPTSFGSTTAVTYSNITNCRDPTKELPGIGITANAVHHGGFIDVSHCSNGSKAVYKARPPNDTITVECEICPSNTFSKAASWECTPCESGLISLPNSSQCAAPPPNVVFVETTEDSDDLSFIAYIFAGILGVLIIAIASFYSMYRYKRSKKNETAPTTDSVCFVALHPVDFGTALWAKHRKELHSVADQYRKIVKEVITEEGVYQVSHNNGSFLIAAGTDAVGIFVATKIQKRIFDHTWPDLLRLENSRTTNSVAGELKPFFPVGAGVHMCTDVQWRHLTLESKFEYKGAEVPVAAALAKTAAPGQTLVTDSMWETTTTHDLTTAKDLYQDFLQPTVTSSTSWAKQMDIEALGVVDLTSLHHNKLRVKFEYIPGHEPDILDDGDISDSASVAETIRSLDVRNFEKVHIQQAMRCIVNELTTRKAPFVNLLASEYGIEAPKQHDRYNGLRTVSAICDAMYEKYTEGVEQTIVVAPPTQPEEDLPDALAAPTSYFTTHGSEAQRETEVETTSKQSASSPTAGDSTSNFSSSTGRVAGLHEPVRHEDDISVGMKTGSSDTASYPVSASTATTSTKTDAVVSDATNSDYQSVVPSSSST